MATIVNTITGAAAEGCRATTNNSASSYGQPVWADAEGNAYMQVGLPCAIYRAELCADEQRQALGAQIRDRRQQLGLTIEALSKASGIAAANISKLERGGTANTETIAKIASAMGMRLALA